MHGKRENTIKTNGFVRVLQQIHKIVSSGSKTAKLAPKPPKLAPRCSQVGFQTPNLASKTAQDGSKILQLGVQEPPRSRPRASKMAPGPSKMAPKPSKMHPRASKSFPRELQEGSKRPRCSKRAQEGHYEAILARFWSHVDAILELAWGLFGTSSSSSTPAQGREPLQALHRHKAGSC